MLLVLYKKDEDTRLALFGTVYCNRSCDLLYVTSSLARRNGYDESNNRHRLAGSGASNTDGNASASSSAPFTH